MEDIEGYKINQMEFESKTLCDTFNLIFKLSVSLILMEILYNKNLKTL